jgi:hypothetical protein
MAPHPVPEISHQRVRERTISKAMQFLDDKVEATWWDLCGDAWAEQDPVKLLDLTMKITKFLALKQQRLDAAYDEAQRKSAMS